MKSYLFVLRNPAHSGAYVQEILDIILTTAAFDQEVTLLMLDDGVFHLKKNQQPDRLGMKDTAAIFEALALYDVNELYVEDESLAERGLNLSDLGLPVKQLSRSAVAEFMKRFDVLVAG